MIAVFALLAGVMIGVGAGYIGCERMHRARERMPALNAVRWEKTTVQVVAPALKHLRRHYPTHEIVTGFPFMDLVHARGSASEAVRRRCGAWTVGFIMVDRRNEILTRVVLWDDDIEGTEKTWILRRAGYKVTIMSRGVDEGRLMATMAA